MKNYLALIALCLCTFLSIDANAVGFNVSGTLQYTRAWANGSYSGIGSLIPPAQQTGVFPLQDVQVCVQRQDTMAVLCPPSGTGYTGSNGAFTSTITAGMPVFTPLKLYVKFWGKDRASTLPTPENNSYKLVADINSTAVLTATIDDFTAPLSSSINVGTSTFQPCVPAIATCSNDFANGHQMLQWIVNRYGVTFGFDNASFKTAWTAALRNIRAHTDRQQNTSCGTGGSNLCCNWDFGHGDIETCWHEMGHAMLGQTQFQRTGGSYGNYPGQGICQGQFESSGGNAIDEGFANLTAVIGGFSANDAANLSAFGGQFAGFCYSTNAPLNDWNNDCTSCEFNPSATTYPMPLTCGADPTANVARTECRHFKLLLDLLDTKQVNGPGCLAETASVSLSTLFDTLTGMPFNSSEEGVKETTIGGTAVGTAQSSIDAFTIMDALRRLPGPSVSDKYRVWANACYMPGEANWGAGNFLPAGGQDNPPF